MIRRATAMHVTHKTKKAAANSDNSPKENADDSNDTLHKELLAHNEYFKRMINLIPANFYFNQEIKDKIDGQKTVTLVSLSNKGKFCHGHIILCPVGLFFI